MVQASLAPHDEQRPRKVARGLALVAAMTLSFTVQMPASAETPQPSPAPSQAADPGVIAADSDGDGTADAPDLSSAAAAARASGSVVEDTSQRTEQTRVVVSPDQTVEQATYAAPVWVKDASGRWVDVDYSLVALAGGGFAPKASPASVVIDGGGAREFARMDLEGGGSTIWSWPVALPTPSVSGPTATYGVGEGVDLLVTATASGVSTRIRINSADAVAPDDFTVQMRTDGVDLGQGSGGALLFDDDGVTAAQSTRLTAWDSRLDVFGDPVEVVAVDSTLVETASNGDVTDQDLTLSTPDELVSDPNVEYPIVIDPDVALVPTEDTWVREGTTWVENRYRLMTGRLNDSPNDHPTISYIEWPNTAATATNHMSGRAITQATLSLFQYAAGACSDRQMNIHPLGGEFHEVSTLYAGKPSANTTSGTSTSLSKNVGGEGCGVANDFVTANVTSMVQAWAAGMLPNYGMQLNAPSDHATDTSYERRFCSSEPETSHTSCNIADRSPKLTFKYAYATQPTPNPPIVGQLKSTGHTWSPTPTLSATLRLTAGDVCAPVSCLKGEFTVKNASGVTVATLVSSAAVADGGTVSVTVPASTGLVDLATYSVTVRVVPADPVANPTLVSLPSIATSFRAEFKPGLVTEVKVLDGGVAATGSQLLIMTPQPTLSARLPGDLMCPGETPGCLTATFEVWAGSRVYAATLPGKRPGDVVTTPPTSSLAPTGSYVLKVWVTQSITGQIGDTTVVNFEKVAEVPVPVISELRLTDGTSFLVRVNDPVVAGAVYTWTTTFTGDGLDPQTMIVPNLYRDAQGDLTVPWTPIGSGEVKVRITASYGISSNTSEALTDLIYA